MIITAITKTELNRTLSAATNLSSLCKNSVRLSGDTFISTASVETWSEQEYWMHSKAQAAGIRTRTETNEQKPKRTTRNDEISNNKWRLVSIERFIHLIEGLLYLRSSSVL